MNSFRAILLACASLTASSQLPLHAASQDDLYLGIYRTIQEADALHGAGQAEQARARYQDAQAGLKRLQSSYPNFNTSAVGYRLEYVTEKLKAIPTPGTPASPTNASAVRPLPSRPGDQVKALSEQVAQLQNENSVLQEKLKEALSAQPAAVDPRKLQEAEERITALSKDRELLNVELEQLKAKQPGAPDLTMFEKTRGDLAAANKRLTETVANLAALSQERQALLTRVASLEQEVEQAKNAVKSAAAPVADPAMTQQLTSLQREVETLKAENSRLHSTVAKNAEVSEGAANQQELKQQVEKLRARLEVFEARKVPFTQEELAIMSKGASIKTVEVAAAPSAPNAAPASPAVTRKAATELPSGAASLVAEAQRAFTARRFDEAEAKYKQVLAMDETNPVTLAGLGAIQVEMGKNQEAEKNLSKALEVNPGNAYTLSLLGLAKFNQDKYDEALDALSKSAQLDPKNPETQNYLGITLSQRGQREAAETALRKAIQLNPGYAGAHLNLAVIYATQKPPMLELARFHYTKALTGGHPKNQTLEQLLNSGNSNP